MKYKEAGNGEYITIFSDTEKTASWNKKNKPGYYREMMAWVAEGNEIEPQFTAEELSAKEAAEAVQALESQKSTCINLLNESEISVSQDPPYPDDVDTWKLYRSELRKILKSDTIQPVPKKPFS